VGFEFEPHDLAVNGF